LKNHLKTAVGTILSAHGRHYLVELNDSNVVLAYPGGRSEKYACGDICEIEYDRSQGRIKSVTPRNTLLWRSDNFRQKLIAANVSLVLIVVATDLPINASLVIRCFLAAEEQGIDVKLIVNKCDLGIPKAITEFKNEYEKLGYETIYLSAIDKANPLKTVINGESVVLVGQSGVGKSTLTNRVVDKAHARTAEISNKLRSGRHTTTHAQLYRINDTTSLIDCPGLQYFGLKHIKPEKLDSLFVEFRNIKDRCQFADCTHTVEPNCAIIDELNKGNLAESRWLEYKKILEEIK